LAEIKAEVEKLENFEKELTALEAAPDEQKIRELHGRLSREELKTLFSGPYDRRDATLAVYAGAGGRDAEDWAGMLWRMYQRWCEKHGYNWQTLDEHRGEAGGLKSAVAEISGQFSAGYLARESGVHRLVRISPFDASKQRHTSFALVEVLPRIEPQEFPIKPEDIEFEAFRSSGPGGQNVNKVETAVRIKHKPTGLVVSAQSERSQERNRERALEILRAKLHNLAVESARQEKAELKGPKTEIEWGRQIRSYVLHPYQLVKDHRTQVETSQIDKVLDGDLDQFIEAEVRLKE